MIAIKKRRPQSHYKALMITSLRTLKSFDEINLTISKKSLAIIKVDHMNYSKKTNSADSSSLI